MEPTQRFSSRVESYARYRPSYPPELLRILADECGLAEGTGVADVGSGTGILSRPLLERGAHVYGVEPNREMRESGERLLSAYGRFTSIAGTAEASTLPDESVDLVTAGQAFHWFDREAARREFARILKPGGFVALVWNSRRPDSSPFLAGYTRLLRECGTDYDAVTERRVKAGELESFFGSSSYTAHEFGNRQTFDLEGLKGRALSSSYVPEPGNPNYEAMIRGLEDLFHAYQRGGAVVFEYDTRVFYGSLRI